MMSSTKNLKVQVTKKLHWIAVLQRNVYSCNEYQKSGTRREERLMDEENLRKVWILRKLLHPMDELAAMEFLLDRMKTKTNDDFFDQMKRKAST